MDRIPLTLAVLVGITSASLSGQVVARQGVSSAAEAGQEFTSPMILEASLKNLGELPMDTGRDFKEFQQFYCDDLVISRLLLAKKPQKGRGILLSITGSVAVRPSYDRLAALRFDFLNGERTIASGRVAGINAEEGKTRVFSTKVRLDDSQYRALLSPPESALFRVTVTVVDND